MDFTWLVQDLRYKVSILVVTQLTKPKLSMVHGYANTVRWACFFKKKIGAHYLLEKQLRHEK